MNPKVSGLITAQVSLKVAADKDFTKKELIDLIGQIRSKVVSGYLCDLIVTEEDRVTLSDNTLEKENTIPLRKYFIIQASKVAGTAGALSFYGIKTFRKNFGALIAGLTETGPFDEVVLNFTEKDKIVFKETP